MAKKVPVTSVTPASKVKATSKAQQSRTRALVMGIATATPIGRAAATAVKTAKAAKAASIAQKKNYEQKITIPARRVVEAAKREKETGVRVIPGKTAPKTDLSSRGARPSAADKVDRALDYEWNKLHGRMDARDEIFYTGLRGPKQGTMRDAGKKNLRKSAAVSREARKKLPIQINSAPKKTADSAKAANAKALKAANKPVSKGNRNIGGPVVRNIIKNSPPARANRTRLGNPAKKK